MMIEVLEKSALFSDCTQEQLEKVAACCERRTYPAGETIFEARAPADHLYVVESGAVELHFVFTCYGAPQQLTLDRKVRGDLVGWSALMAARTFTLSAVTARDATLLRIPSAALAALCEDDRFGHVVMRRLAATIAHRFNVLQQMLIDMVQERLVR